MIKLEKIAQDNATEGRGFAVLLPSNGVSTHKPFAEGELTVGGKTYALRITKRGQFPKEEFLILELS